MALITMVKRFLVTGKNGQLGKSLNEISPLYPEFDLCFVDRRDLDLSSSKSITEYFNQHNYDAIINCAAYTAVDKAESDTDLANQVNHLAVKQMAEIAKSNEIPLIHISTDYVFNGQNYKPYTEEDQTSPKSVYGQTKLDGERAILNITPYGCIIRTSWVYSEYGNNFVKTMMKLGSDRDQLGIIFDQVGSPTYATDLAKAILQIANRDQLQETGNKIFHFSNEGVCSWYDLAKAIFEYSAIECNVTPIETKDYPTPAKRPHYSLMNKTHIKQTFELEIPYWRDSLKACIQKLKEQA